MYELVSGDIFESTCDVLVNPVNCVGVMGKGLALQFKQRYPEMFALYAEDCRNGRVRLGVPLLYYVGDGKMVCNFPTKGHWREKSDMQDIRAGLSFLMNAVKLGSFTSIAFPLLGAGLGGLDKEAVTYVLRQWASELSIRVEIYV